MSNLPETICRICEEYENLVNISLPESNGLIVKYLACANVSFDINDKLPKYFCKHCITSLHSSYTFKEQCENTQKKFNHFLGIAAVKNEQIEGTTAAADPSTSQVISDTENGFENTIFLDDDESVHKTTEIVSRQIKDLQIKCLDKDDCNKSNSMTKDTLIEPKPNVKCRQTEHRCISCNINFANRNDMQMHRQLPHKCSICNETMRHALSLYRHHRRIHLCIKDAAQYKCNICNKQFSNQFNMQRHQQSVHEGLRSYTCDICNKHFSRFESIRLHMYKHAGGKKQIECQTCSKAFGNNILLKMHQKRHLACDHTSRKMCDLCGQICSNLWNHKQKHTAGSTTKEKSFQCPICLKRFGTKDHMRRHSVIHTKEKPYECVLCTAKFSHESALYMHRLMHTGERPHKCTLCDAAFRQKPHLKTHLRTHTGEKPCVCPFCGKGLANRANLTVHMRRHVNEQPSA